MTKCAGMVYFLGKMKGNDEDSSCFPNVTASRGWWEPVSVGKQGISLLSCGPKGEGTPYPVSLAGILRYGKAYSTAVCFALVMSGTEGGAYG